MKSQNFDQLQTDPEHVPLEQNLASINLHRSFLNLADQESAPIFTPGRSQTKLHRQSQASLKLHGPKLKGMYPVLKLEEISVNSQVGDMSQRGFTNDIWRTKALEIWMIVLRFISFITKSNFATSFRLVNQQIFNIIGDKSANYRFYQFNNFLKYDKPSKYQRLKYKLNQHLFVPLRKLSIYQYFDKNKLIIRPESIISVGWNIYILFILNLNVMYASTKVAFHLQADNIVDQLGDVQNIFFDVLPSYCFLLEIILKFNTCYYHKGNLIENRFLIAKNYLRTTFLFDICVIIPYFLSLRFSVSYLDLVLILKVFQIRKFSGTLSDRLELSDSQIAIFDLAKLCYTILAAAHFCACLWFLIGITGDPTQNSWVKQQGIEDADFITQYICSFYFSIVTMTTIGYGDITPQNVRERAFNIGMAVVAVGVFGYSIGNISNIFAEWQRKSYQFRSDMNNLKKYMRVKGYNKHLSEKVRKYFEYIWSDQNEENDREAYKYQELLPLQLQEEMKIDINLRIVQKVGFLMENFSSQFLTNLSRYLVEEKYAPEQTIFHEGQVSDAFYILDRGKLEFYVNLKNKEQQQRVLEYLSVSDIDPNNIQRSMAFGQLEFFTNQAHPVSCKSTQFSYIFKIDRKTFTDLLKENPADYEQFIAIRDKIFYQQRQDIIQVYCRACNKFNHVIKECPMVCGYPNRSKVLLNYRRNIPTDRLCYSRNSTFRNLSATQDNKNIKNSVLLYMSRNKQIQQHINEATNNMEDDIDVELNNHCPSPVPKEFLRSESSSAAFSFNNLQQELQDPITQQRVQRISAQLKLLGQKNSSPLYVDSLPRSFDKFREKQQTQNPIILNNKIFQDTDEQEGSNSKFQIITPPTRQVTFKRQATQNYDTQASPTNEEEDTYEMMRGQYKELFYEFEKYKNYEKFLEQNNIRSIIVGYNKKVKQLIDCLFKQKRKQI
ncbi:hypothetical protein pb186bvf_011643 [Paramecium bursaria]